MRRERFRTIVVVAVLASASFLAGCAETRGPSGREAGTLAGGAIGAGLGAIVGNQVGSSGAGIAIGSAFGALGGALLGNAYDVGDEKLDRHDELLRAREREIAENRRILEELRARGADARPTDRGVVVNLPDVLFEFDRAALTGPARQDVGEIADVLRNVGPRRIFVEGHTDSVGTAEYNEALSLDRAHAVSDSLIYRGVPRRAVTVRGFGERRPVASNAAASGRSRNRRVEVVIENRR